MLDVCSSHSPITSVAMRTVTPVAGSVSTAATQPSRSGWRWGATSGSVGGRPASPEA